MIGFFDSGYGGLTVLRAVMSRLPDRDLIYLGDHQNAPYGGRSTEEIYDLTIHAVERLFGIGCHLVILACNTASAVALRRLQQTWLPKAYPERRVLGVLVPVVEAITRQPWQIDAIRSPSDQSELVAIFGTRMTIASGAYPREIAKRAPGVTVVQQACPQLAALIEEGASDGIIRPLIRQYSASLRAQIPGVLPDSAVLACTHYPLVANMFCEALPAEIDILNQPDLVGRSLEAYLSRRPQYDCVGKQGGHVGFLTTGDPVAVSDLGSRFFGAQISFCRERLAA